MINYLTVELVSQTASFRNPDFQNYHKSFALPPPTTIMGISGAAMGLSPKQTQQFFDEDEFYLGVYGKNKGISNDLWKYKNFDNTRSIIHREMLFLNNYIIVIGTDCDEKFEELYHGFLSPCYALTLGNSDSLAFIKVVTKGGKLTESREIESCLVEGDVLKETIDSFDFSKPIEIYKSSSEPVLFHLPVSFSYDSDYGARSVIKRKAFSFIDKKMTLSLPKEGILWNGKFIPLNALK